MKNFRLFHVLFAAAVLAAYFTGEKTGVIHAWLGYGVAVLILLRIVLGLSRAAGFSFARFRIAVRSRAGSKSGMRLPAIGNALTLAFALAITGTASTGIIMDRGGTLVGQSVRLESEDGDHEEGEHEEREDLSSFRGLALPGLVSPAYADDGSATDEDALEEVHEVFGKLTLILAIAHALYTLVFRFGMARFMLFLPARRTT